MSADAMKNKVIELARGDQALFIRLTSGETCTGKVNDLSLDLLEVEKEISVFIRWECVESIKIAKKSRPMDFPSA